MSQYSGADSNGMEPAVEYDEGVMYDRDAVRKGVWYQALGIVEYMRDERLPKDDQRVQKRLALRMPFLGEQPLEEWVNELEHLVRQEMWLEDAYQALWWYWARYLPWTAEHDKPEGEEFDGPGLLWETLSELDFGSPTQARFRDLFEWRESLYDWDDTHKIEQDLVHLVTREMELEQDYQQLFYASAKTQQESVVTDPEPETFSWDEIVEVYWEEPQVPGGDGTEVSLPVLQGCWAVIPDPQWQLNIPRGDSKPHNSADGTVVSALEPQGDGTPNSDGADGTVVSASDLQGCWMTGPDLQLTPQECQEEEVSDPSSPQPIRNQVLGVGFPDLIPAELLASGQSAVGLCPLLLSCPEPDSPQATPAEELASGQSAVGLCPPLFSCPEPEYPHATPAEELTPEQSSVSLCPPRTYSSISRKTREITGSRRTFCSLGPTELSWTPENYRCSTLLWVGCSTNLGTDRQEVTYLFSLPRGGKMCDESTFVTRSWRGLHASLLPCDYGPWDILPL